MQEIVLCKEMVNMCVDLKIKMELKWYMMITFIVKDFSRILYTHTHTCIYMLTNTKYIYAHVCMYAYRRNQFQTRIGRELGGKFSQVKKAGKERGSE